MSAKKKTRQKPAAQFESLAILPGNGEDIRELNLRSYPRGSVRFVLSNGHYFQLSTTSTNTLELRFTGGRLTFTPYTSNVVDIGADDE